MTQDERRLEKYNDVVEFIQTNHRNPSRHNPEERYKFYNWIKHNKKLLNSGELKQERVVTFEKMLQLCETYKRVNQYK